MLCMHSETQKHLSYGIAGEYSISLQYTTSSAMNRGRLQVDLLVCGPNPFHCFHDRLLKNWQGHQLYRNDAYAIMTSQMHKENVVSSCAHGCGLPEAVGTCSIVKVVGIDNGRQVGLYRRRHA